MKVVLAGAGAFGLKHLDAIRTIDGVEVVSLVGRRSSRPARWPRKYGVPHVTTDLAEALARPASTPRSCARRPRCMRAQAIAVHARPASMCRSRSRSPTAGRRQAVVSMQKGDRRSSAWSATRAASIPRTSGCTGRSSAGELSDPADGRADLFLPPHEHERQGRAAVMDRPPALAPRRAHRRPVPVPDGRDGGRSPTPSRARTHPELGIAMDMSIQLKSSTGAICTLSLSFNNDGPLGTFFRYICDNGTYIARYDDLFTGKDEKVDVSKVDVSMNGIELQDREFFAAIREGREPNASVAPGAALLQGARPPRAAARGRALIMRSRPIGAARVAEIGLGCMPLSHAYGVPPSSQESAAVLHRALELGVSHFDTAALYGFGANEALLGQGARRPAQQGPPCNQVRHDRCRRQACHRRTARYAATHLPRVAGAPRDGGHRPLVPASLGPAGPDRGKHRRDGGDDSSGTRACPGPFGSLGGDAAAGPRRAPHRRRAERILALEPQSGARPARSLPRARHDAGRVRAAGSGLPRRCDRRCRAIRAGRHSPQHAQVPVATPGSQRPLACRDARTRPGSRLLAGAARTRLAAADISRRHPDTRHDLRGSPRGERPRRIAGARPGPRSPGRGPGQCLDRERRTLYSRDACGDRHRGVSLGGSARTERPAMRRPPRQGPV